MARSAIGLVYRPAETPSVDRDWARGLVVRHARGRRLNLLDVFELDDDPDRRRDVLARLATLARSSSAHALVVEGVDSVLAESIAHDLHLVLEPAPHRERSDRLR